MLSREEFCKISTGETYEEFGPLLQRGDTELFRVDECCVEHTSEQAERSRNDSTVAMSIEFQRKKAQNMAMVDGNGQKLLTGRYNGEGTWTVYLGDSCAPRYDHLSHSKLLVMVRNILLHKTVLYIGKVNFFLVKGVASLNGMRLIQIKEFLDSTYGNKLPPMYIEYCDSQFSYRHPRWKCSQSIVLLHRAVSSKFDFELFYKEVLP